MNVLLHICTDFASVDLYSNKLSLFNIIEELNAASFPVFLQQFTIVTMLERTEDEPDSVIGSFKVTFDSRNKELFETSIEFKFQQHLRTRNISNFSGLLLPAPGRLSIELYLDGNIASSWPIHVNQIGQPEITSRAVPSDGKTSRIASAKKVASKKSKS